MMIQYSLLTYDNRGDIIACRPFESEFDDLAINPHDNQNVPFTVGSNQYIVHWGDDGVIQESECYFCGHTAICKEYFTSTF